MDPMAEKYYSVSPYAFCSGNPVNFAIKREQNGLLILPSVSKEKPVGLNFVDWDGRDALINIDRESKTITISVNIYIYGKEASDELASQYKESISNTWGSIQDLQYDDETYTINWNVEVTNLGEEKVEFDFSDGKSNYLNIMSDVETSSVEQSHEGKLRPIINGNNDMIHEFGHLLGLKDKYGTDRNDPKTYRKALAGYEGNVMAEQAGMGVVEPSNVEGALYPVFNSRVKGSVYRLHWYNSESKRTY